MSYLPTLEICGDGHEVIGYTKMGRSYKCPLCKANKDIGDLQERLRKLELEKLEK